VIVLAGTSTELVEKALNWNKDAKGCGGAEEDLRCAGDSRRFVVAVHGAVKS
jgi:hypothetical protein